MIVVTESPRRRTPERGMIVDEVHGWPVYWSLRFQGIGRCEEDSTGGLAGIDNDLFATG